MMPSMVPTMIKAFHLWSLTEKTATVAPNLIGERRGAQWEAILKIRFWAKV
jgi:hypothetical protein